MLSLGVEEPRLLHLRWSAPHGFALRFDPGEDRSRSRILGTPRPAAAHFDLDRCTPSRRQRRRWVEFGNGWSVVLPSSFNVTQSWQDGTWDASFAGRQLHVAVDLAPEGSEGWGRPVGEPHSLPGADAVVDIVDYLFDGPDGPRRQHWISVVAMTPASRLSMHLSSHNPDDLDWAEAVWRSIRHED